jgi:chromosome segregation ATPase
MNFQLPGGNTSGLFSPGGNGLELASTQQQPLSPLPHPSQPAMMLFQQNSRLTNGIDSTRKEYKKCLEDIEDTKENTKQILQVDRKTIEEQIKAAIQEREDLLEELEMTLMEQLVTMQEEESEAKTSRDQAQDRFQTAEDTIVDRRKAFMQACGEYRHRIQVLSYQGEALDIKNFLAPLLACAVLQSHTEDNVPDQETNKEWSSNLDKVVAGLSEVIGIRDCDKKNDEEDDDEELKEALQALKKQKLSMKMTHDVLQKLLAKKETTTQNHEKREVQKKNLLSQRQRLEEDVKSLRVQIQDTQQQTEETQAMIAVFKNGKSAESNSLFCCLTYGHFPHMHHIDIGSFQMTRRTAKTINRHRVTPTMVTIIKIL